MKERVRGRVRCTVGIEQYVIELTNAQITVRRYRSRDKGLILPLEKVVNLCLKQPQLFPVGTE